MSAGSTRTGSFREMIQKETEDGGVGVILVVGNDPVGAVVARDLPGDVVFRGLEEKPTRRVAGDVRDVGSVADVNRLQPPDDVDSAVVATASDSINMLVAKRLCLASETEVLVRLNDPDHRQAFADIGFETVCATTTLGETISDRYTRLVE